MSKQDGILDIKLSRDTPELFNPERARNIAKLIRETDRTLGLPNFPPVYVRVEDNAGPPLSEEGSHILPFCTSENITSFDLVFPDYIFWSWSEIGVKDYDETTALISKIGESPPATEMMGWRGANTHAIREKLVQRDDSTRYDFKMVEWDRSNPDRFVCTNQVSLPDHAKRWRYLIDLEGYGYSGRLKMLMFSRRVVFIQDRTAKEWFFQYMKPWEHYVPVRRDLLDLDENLEFLRSNPELERRIVENASAFAASYLTREAALRRIHQILHRISELSNVKVQNIIQDNDINTPIRSRFRCKNIRRR